MGWVWKDEADDVVESNRDVDERCSTRKLVRSQCKTEEVEAGKFIRKCETTEQLLRECVGRPVEVLQSNKEYTEDDVTEQVLKGSLSSRPHQEAEAFDFPRLRSDLKEIEEIERRLFGGVNRFFDAAEEMKKSVFDAFGVFDGLGSSAPAPPSVKRGIPVEDQPQKQPSRQPDSHIDLSGLAKDV